MALLLVPQILIGCDAADQARSAPSPPAGVVDSIFPLDEQIRRFTADLPDRPAALRGGATSPLALAQRLHIALVQADTLALATLLVSRAEFAYLIYPEHPFSRAPYALPPHTMWMMTQAGTAAGLSRAVAQARQTGHRELSGPVHCDRVESHGTIRLHVGCVATQAGDGVPLALGTLVERGSHFKVYALGE